MVLEYYRLLRSLRKIEALSRCFLIRCKCCRIYFLAHWRNRCQINNLRCPFGCREQDDHRRSIQRSLAYYREHPEKKRAQNQKRYRLVSSPDPIPPGRIEPLDIPSRTSAESAHAEPLPQCPPELAEVLPKAQDPQLMRYARVIVSLIEGRPVSLEEIWQALLHFWRQRTIGRRGKIDHTLGWLKANPP